MNETIPDQVQKISDLWEYLATKVSEERATKLMAHLGLDNPHNTITNNIDYWKKLIDKFLRFNQIIKGETQ